MGDTVNFNQIEVAETENPKQQEYQIKSYLQVGNTINEAKKSFYSGDQPDGDLLIKVIEARLS